MAKKTGKPRGKPGDAERMARMRAALAARRARPAGADLVELQRGAAGAGERDLLQLGDQAAPEWPTILDMIASEFPEFMGETWWGWRVYLKVLAALPLDEQERTFAQEHTGRTAMPTTPVRRAFVGAGRRGGKSLIDALLIVYLATRRRTWTLAPGEWSTIPVVAADRAQARVLHAYCRGLLEASPRLRGMVVKATKDTIVLSNRTQIRVFTASFKTSRGYTLAGAVGDEISFWENSDTSTNPDKEILTALKPGLMTSRGPLLITSTPYSRRGELWEAFKAYWGKDDANGIYWKASSLDMNPALDPADIEAAYAEDPEAARAEYGGEFRTDLAAFISEELIASAVIAGRGDLPYDPKQTYVAFTDPSGGSIGGDSYTLAIGHVERGGIVVIDCLRESLPPFSPEGVTQSHAEVCAMYKVREVVGDHYAAQWPVEAWKKAGVTYVQSEAPKSDLYLAALPVLTSGKVELPDHTRLIRQLRGLERRTARSGKDSVDHGPRGKDDIANSVCGLIALLKYKRQSWGHLTWAYNITTAEKARWFYAGKGGMRADGYLGDGKFMTKSGEIYRDPRYS